MANFYKQNGSYFNSTDNSKILNPTDLQTLASAGGKEISAPTIQPKVDSSTLNLGVQNSNVNLPSSNDQAVSLYTDRTIADGTKQQTDLQAELNNLKSQRIKDTQTQLASEQATNNNLVTDKNTQITNYDTKMNPLKDKAVGIYDSMLNSIKDTNYTELVQQKLNLTNDIVNYSKMMSDELATASSRGGISSIATNRSNDIKENYTSKIAIAQASQSAIDGNFNLAFDIMDKGANAIQNLTTDRINFINTVKGIYDQPISESNAKITTLTADQKKLLDQAVNDAQTKLDNVQANKDTIMELMRTNPIIANKAGLSLTDTPEKITQKLNDFYVANPQYTPDNQAWIKGVMEKYYDAGITMNDSLVTVKSKVLNSNSYKNEQSTNQLKLTESGFVYDNNGNLVKDVSSSTADQIAEAIKQVESGGNYNAQGGSGENGAYQFMPATWRAWSSDYASQVLQESVAKLPMTEENQDAVAKWKIQSWLDQGLTPQQIAAKWNSGSEIGWENKIGTNSKGIAYDVPSYVNKVVKALAGNEKINNDVINWANQVSTGERKFSDVPKELQTDVNNYMSANGSISKIDAEANAKLQDKITQIDELIKGTSNSGAVGPNFLARTSLTSWFTGTRQAFVGSVKQLLSKETIDTLINLKKGGGTLGALSDQERIMLQNAATKIGGWEMKDNSGNGTGFYDVRETDFIKELENIKTLAKRAIDNAGGQTGIINTLEQNLASNPDRVDEYNQLVSDNPNLTEDDINQLMGFK